MVMNSFRAISLSYKTAGVQARELFVFNEVEISNIYGKIKDFFKVSELLVVSTCNRTEMYYVADQSLDVELVKFLCVQKQLSGYEQYASCFLSLEGKEAVRHLFCVAIGLDSQVVGDAQIIHQIKNAYQWSVDAGMSGPYLHKLLHSIFYCKKKVINQTTFQNGAASVASAGLELIESIVTDPTVNILVVGLGEIGTDFCRSLNKSKFINITICNRTLSRAQKLTDPGLFRVAPYEYLWTEIAKADIVVSSIFCAEPLITKEKLLECTILSHKYLFDLAMPRSIEAKVEEIPGVILHNIDDIRARADTALQDRMKAVPQVIALIDTAVAEFEDWHKETVISPTLQKIKDALEQIRLQELARFAKHINTQEQHTADLLSRSIIQKIMKLPVLQLKAACKKGEEDTLIAILQGLFVPRSEEHILEAPILKNTNQTSNISNQRS